VRRLEVQSQQHGHAVVVDHSSTRKTLETWRDFAAPSGEVSQYYAVAKQ